MCGIIGVFNAKDPEESVKTGLLAMENRGKDNSGIHKAKDYAIGHLLHSVVGNVKQPLIGKGILIANCEIYNWKDLCVKHDLKADNDAHLLLQLLDKIEIGSIKNLLDELDGVYAFAYIRDNILTLARDIIGIKPLWYSSSDIFAFASEKKALEKIGVISSIELNPRKILVYSIKDKSMSFIQREFFKTTPQLDISKEDIIQRLIPLLQESVRKRVPERRFGLLFSGGIDSALIALLLKSLGKEFTCYTAVLDDPSLKAPEDLSYSIKAAGSLGIPLKVIKIRLDQVESYLKRIIPLIEDTNVVKVGVALPFFAACEEARKDGCKVIFSGLGSEELFAGYERHKKSDKINDECISGLLKMYERDTYRDDVITMNNNLELRLPFLDKKLTEFSLKIPGRYKIDGERSKIILRDAAIKLSLPKEFAQRKKRAAQYGSNFHKSLIKLAKKDKHKTISSYLRQFYPSHNLRLGALISSGKDSIYAMHVMQKQNYEISCMITMRSTNPDSYMFHTPGIDMVKLQSVSIGIPLLEQNTEGKKESELEDLKAALTRAKKEFDIQGIVTGALFSNYQRERIEKVADSLGLKIFSPLWHMDQETELRQIISEGFRFILTKVACLGLDKSWLNRIIQEKDIDELITLNKKYGINIAFEGGEAESLMIDGPIFSKRIEIASFEVKGESKEVAELMIKRASLAEK